MAKTHARLKEVKDVPIHEEGGKFILSPEEHRIIVLIMAGYTNIDMARQFSLNASTISRRTSRILGKLGVSNRLELVFYAIQHGIVSGFSKNEA